MNWIVIANRFPMDDGKGKKTLTDVIKNAFNNKHTSNVNHNINNNVTKNWIEYYLG